MLTVVHQSICLSTRSGIYTLALTCGTHRKEACYRRSRFGDLIEISTGIVKRQLGFNFYRYNSYKIF